MQSRNVPVAALKTAATPHKRNESNLSGRRSPLPTHPKRQPTASKLTKKQTTPQYILTVDQLKPPSSRQPQQPRQYFAPEPSAGIMTNVRSPSFNQAASIEIPPADSLTGEQAVLRSISPMDAIVTKLRQKQRPSSRADSALGRSRVYGQDQGEDKHSSISVYNDNAGDKNEKEEGATTERLSGYKENRNKEDVGKVFEAIAGLSEQVRDMRRTMNRMQIVMSEKDAEIVRLKMSLGDERQKVPSLLWSQQG